MPALPGKSASKTTTIDFVFFHFVAENPFGRVEQPGGARAIASCGLQRVLDQILLEGVDGLIQTHLGYSAGTFGGLQRRRQMVAVNDVALADQRRAFDNVLELAHVARPDRKSTRLNSSHLGISYAVFCLK